MNFSKLERTEIKESTPTTMEKLKLTVGKTWEMHKYVEIKHHTPN